MDQHQGNPDLATTWGTYSYITLGSHGSLWTPHDQAKAEIIRTHAPNVFQGIQIIRWFAEYAGERLAEQQLDGYMDIGAGVPEEGYLHHQVAPHIPVLYNDRDPGVVAKSRELLTGTTNVHYSQHDVRDIDAVLTEADQHFNGQRKVGILAVGLLYFLDDATVRTVLERLYDWSAPGSMLAINAWRDLPDDPGAQKVQEMYRRQGVVLYGRDPEHMNQLLGGWQFVEPGWQNVEDILRDVRGFDRVATAETRGRLGYGGFMIHP